MLFILKYKDVMPDALKVSAPYAAVVFVLLYITFFALGPGSIPYFYTTEIFGSNARASATSWVAAINWTFTIVVAQCFPLLQQELGQYVFLIFVGCLGLTIAFIAVYAPETKGRTLEEITADIDRRKPRCC
ncbi:Protein FGT-1 a [Aphelenchoides avenae]|nr:Protein FGT-1 a [Aphelenchus avenae]